MSTQKTLTSLRNRGLVLVSGVLCLALPLLSAVSCSVGGDSGAGGGDNEERSSAIDEEAIKAIPSHPHKAVCDAAPPGFVRCHARVRTQVDSDAVQPFATPSGLKPADLQAAYAIPPGGAGLTVAIVDAFDDPNAESDLATYRSQFGLPPCTTANGCFKKVNQNGATSPLPASDVGWAEEISLDLDMVSAICPSCKILLVEASSTSIANLGAAVNRAATMGAVAISNSYGGNESSSSATTDAQFYNHPGISITASSGDSGFGVEFPASGAHVISVGGTSLTKSSTSRGWSEGVWSGAGSGCSTRITKPSFQKDTGCAKRTVADVSAVANPSTGVAVFDSFGGVGGWLVFGGTSAAAPIIAATLAATGKAGVDNSWPYAHTSAFFDVTTGNNGSCGGSYLCTAVAGYDGPSGLGTPNGALFSSGGSTTSSTSTSTSTSTSSSSSSSSSTGGGNTCSHAICSTGTRLTKTCSACVNSVCTADSFCCQSSWDSICVGEVGSICGESCPGAF